MQTDGVCGMRVTDVYRLHRRVTRRAARHAASLAKVAAANGGEDALQPLAAFVFAVFLVWPALGHAATRGAEVGWRRHGARRSSEAHEQQQAAGEHGAHRDGHDTGRGWGKACLGEPRVLRSQRPALDQGRGRREPVESAGQHHHALCTPSQPGRDVVQQRRHVCASLHWTNSLLVTNNLERLRLLRL